MEEQIEVVADETGSESSRRDVGSVEGPGLSNAESALFTTLSHALSQHSHVAGESITDNTPGGQFSGNETPVTTLGRVAA